MTVQDRLSRVVVDLRPRQATYLTTQGKSVLEIREDLFRQDNIDLYVEVFECAEKGSRDITHDDDKLRELSDKLDKITFELMVNTSPDEKQRREAPLAACAWATVRALQRIDTSDENCIAAADQALRALLQVAELINRGQFARTASVLAKWATHLRKVQDSPTVQFATVQELHQIEQQVNSTFEEIVSNNSVPALEEETWELIAGEEVPFTSELDDELEIEYLNELDVDDPQDQDTVDDVPSSELVGHPEQLPQVIGVQTTTNSFWPLLDYVRFPILTPLAVSSGAVVGTIYASQENSADQFAKGLVIGALGFAMIALIWHIVRSLGSRQSGVGMI